MAQSLQKPDSYQKVNEMKHLLFACLVVLFSSCEQKISLVSREYAFLTKDSIILAGTLTRPAEEVKSPLIILVHGSGNDSRENEYYKLLTKEFCQIGYSVFTYDKRGCNASSGSWLSVPFYYLKDDVLTIVNEFAGDSTITNIGLWGGSEGSNVAVWAASESTEIDFVIAQSFTAMTFAEQNKFVKQTRLKHYPNAGDQTLKDLLHLQDLLYHYVRTGRDYDAYISAFNNFRNEEWFADILQQPVTENSPWSKWYKTKLDINSSLFLNHVHVPVLFVWGQNDALIDVEKSMNILKMKNVGDNITFKVFKNADHSLYAGGRRPVHLKFMKDWLNNIKK